MAGVYGSKVKEPKLVRRSGLPLDKQAPYTADLAQAWTSFGEAKTVLQRLEQTTGSPPIKDRTQRRLKPHHVHFHSQRGAGVDSTAHHHGRTKTLYASGQGLDDDTRSRGERGRDGKENEYVVEPKALNDVEDAQSGMEYDTHQVGGSRDRVAKSSPLRDSSSRVAVSESYKPPERTTATRHKHAREGHSQQSSSHRYDSSVRFAVPPTVSTSSSPTAPFHHPSPPSHSHTYVSRNITTASPSNPNSIGSVYPPRMTSTTSAPPYSNSTAVFGPPVKFGNEVKSRQLTMVKPTESSRSLHHLPGTITTTTATATKPRTSATISQLSSTSRVPSAGAEKSTTVPIRTFELPTDTLSTLRAKIERQKQAMHELSAKTGSLGAKGATAAHSSTGTFYPLPDASTTATSSFASSSSVGNGPRVPHPPLTGHPHDTDRAAKRRKIASAPPPQTYTGFSLVRSGPKSETHESSSGGGISTSALAHGRIATLSWKPNLETVGVGMAGGVAFPSSGGGVGTHFSTRPSKKSDDYDPSKRSHQVVSKRVRKVQRIPTAGVVEGNTATAGVASSANASAMREAWGASRSAKPGAGESNLITTSSWRAGKELTDRVLKGSNVRERGERTAHDYRSRRDIVHSPTHSYSSVSESQSYLCSSQGNVSPTSSSVDLQVQPERGKVDEERLGHERHRDVSPSWTKLKGEGGASFNRGGVHVDVAGLLEDLESPVTAGGESGREGERGRRSETMADERERVNLSRARSTSGGPSSKKPRYNIEPPAYPTERVRHYDQAEVQSYMQKKQEDRRRKELEERQARERTTKEREEKLKQLYESQRKRVEANLRLKQKQREAYSKALASSSVHVHLHGGSTSSSTSTFASGPAAMPTLQVVPPTPVSLSPTVGSLTLHVHTGSRSPYRSPPSATPSPHHHSLSPMHISPVPPSHSPRPSSPPRYGRIGTSPTSGEAVHVHSPSISPRTYSVPSSTSSSPKTHQSPSGASEHAHLRHSPSTEQAQYVGRTEHSYSSVQRSGDHTGAGLTAPMAHQSREERIRALTESALRLKERIVMESKRFEDGSFGASGKTKEHLPPNQQRWSSPTRQLFVHQTNQQGFTPTSDLPGVRNVCEHAQQAERLHKQAEAATKIQAAYRGHCVRKSLHWKLPSGQTLGASLRGGLPGTVDNREESKSSSAGTLTPPAEEDKNGEKISTPVISPMREEPGHQQPISFTIPPHQSPPMASTVPRLSLWQQQGGDEHSVINVFTRQHERLRQTLDQLRDQKRAEIRGLSKEKQTASETQKSGGSPSSAAQVAQPTATSVSHSYYYTHTFEQASPSGSATSNRSPHSSVFSEDSLHVSPPKQGAGSKASLSPSSSTHSQQTSPKSATSSPLTQKSAITGMGGGGDTAAGPHSSKIADSKAQQENAEETIHAITPPGSPSFVESFASVTPKSASSSRPKSQSPKPPAQGSAQSANPLSSVPPSGAQPTSAQFPPPTEGRLSPRSLQLKLHSELNLLETVEDSMRQLSQVESARAVSLAQQETVALAQLLKSRQQSHEEVQSVASKNEKEMEEAQAKLDREAAMMSEQRKRMEREHAEEMLRMREEASRISHEATMRINEARSAASEAVIQAAKQHLEAAHNIAASAASSAAREAVKATLVTNRQQRSSLKEQNDERSGDADGVVSPAYESDFESDSLTGSETRSHSETHDADFKLSPTTSKRSHASTSSTIEEDIDEGGNDDSAATPVAPPEEVMEVTQVDTTLVGDVHSELEESYQSPLEELEEDEGDISETSLRELLPSESHRRQQAKLSKEELRRRRRLSGESEEFHSRGSSPSHGEGSRVPSPMPSELSPSPGAGEDSFFQFMSRMVRAYMHEEELRSRHQATLLRLREDALQEKTKAHLEWLKIKKAALQKKGDDDKMPPLAQKERGLLKEFKQQQAEIHQLKEAQKAARRERRLMLQQQKEISQMRQSAQYYRDKIHQHSRRITHSPSPSLSLHLPDEIQNISHLLDESEVSVGDFSVAEELSESDEHKSLISAPSEDLEHSMPKEYSEDFPSYSTSPEPVPTATVQTETGGDKLGDDGDRTLTESSTVSSETPVKLKPKAKTSPAAKKSPPGVKKSKVLKSPTSESHTVNELEKLAATDHHKYLSRREQRLLKRRKAAEKVLKQQQELLKKEQILDHEEEQVNKLVNEALTCYQQRTKIKKERTKERSRHSSSEEAAIVNKPESPKSREMSAGSPPLIAKEAGVIDRSKKKEEIQTRSSISEDIRPSNTITEEISEVLLSKASTSQPLSVPSVHTTSPKVPSNYAMDTFESFQSTTLSHQDHPPHPTTSTPSHESFKKQPQASEDLSISITESLISMTSDESDVEERIRLLKQQLQQEKEEMKQYQNEQKRKKKAVLRQLEEQLKRKLEMVKSRTQQMKLAGPSVPIHSPGAATPPSSASATSSLVHSERSESNRSRESTASPQPAPQATQPSLPLLSSIITGAPVIKTTQGLATDDDKRSESLASVQEQLSPAAPPSYSYTPFSDSIATASVSGEKAEGLTHEDTKVDGDIRIKSESSEAIPKEHNASNSTFVERMEEEEGEEAVAASVERVEDETVTPEDKPLKDQLSSRESSISEHISDVPSEEDQKEELLDVGEPIQPPLVVPEDGRGVSLSNQYSDSFEEPSSAPSSQTLPLRESTLPLEAEDKVAFTEATEEEPLDSEEKGGVSDQEGEQEAMPDFVDGETDEEPDYQIGQRVLVGNVMRGTIRYVGHTHFAKGVWVGVEIDLPRGRNDGSIDSQRYFTCEPNYGLFAPPEKITFIDEDEEENLEDAEEEEEEEGEGVERQPGSIDEVSSVAEELEVEEQLSSEQEEGDGEDYGDQDQLHVDENVPPQLPLPQEDIPSPVEDGYSSDFEPSEEEEDEEKEEGKVKDEEELEQSKDDYQWPTSRESTKEPSPLAEDDHHLEEERTSPVPHHIQDNQQEKEEKSQASEVTEVIDQKSTGDETVGKVGEETSPITEHPPPAREVLETLGEKSESFPQAPEVANQRSQSATPTPAPPPEFAEGASKEVSIEPPPPLQLTGEMAPTLKQRSDVISEELAQELTNEAYETMHNIWKVKREVHQLASKGQASSETETTTSTVSRDTKLSLNDKADQVTDQLLCLLLQSETNLACSIHNFKKSQEEEIQQVISPTTKLPRSPVSKEPERPVLSPVPEEPLGDEDDESNVKGEDAKEEEVVTPPRSPSRPGAPARLILTGTSNIIESSPPPLSPPSPYRTSPFIPSFTPAADEFSPPGSPPKHLSQASAARVAAGEKTPFMSSLDKEKKGIERSTSTESITSLLDSLKIKTAQCMVPSERTNINEIVRRSWEVCEAVGFDRLHSNSPTCPSEVLDMFSDLHELSPEESHCRRAYLELVFNLTVETLQSLHCTSEDAPVWTHESAVRALLVPEHKNGGEVTLEKIQKRVYKSLMRGQLPSQLPSIKFLKGMKRPGGREIDFVDAILIKELREEEPGWIDYCGDEASVKMKTADAILDSLITETVQIITEIRRNHVSRQSTYS